MKVPFLKTMSSTPSEHEANGGTAVQRGKRKTRKSMNYGDPYKSSQAPKEAALDTLATMILSRVDEVEHEKAVWEDADRVMRNHILPKTLPWAKPRIELLRSLPRDIEDMPGVWHAGEDQSGDVYRKDINSGLFGFGMHDSGGLLKADLSTTTPQVSFSPKPGTGISDMPSSPTRTPTRRRAAIGAEEILHHFHEETNLECNDTFTAAARRSEDPGIIELAGLYFPICYISNSPSYLSNILSFLLFLVKLPLPSKTTALLKFHNHRMPQDTSTSEKILQGERAETCSKMPLYWDKVDGNVFQEPPAFVKDEDIEEKLLDDKDFSMYTYMKERSNRKRKIEELTKACSRNWKISVKFANTSSRSNLAPKVKNAMILLAELPSYVQNGQALTYESALLKDKEEGLREKLGSYDCRATSLSTSMSFDAMDGTKASKSAGRSKRLNVGRTRLIWSGVSNAAGNKLNFSSLLSGEKLDSGSYKRPRDVKVMIRLNGNIIQEEMEEDSDKKRNREIFSEKFSWSSSKVSQAVETACPTVNGISTVTEQREEGDEDGPCYFPENVHCNMDCISYFGSLMAGKKVPNEETSIKTPSGIEMTFDRPQFICMPVDEGFMRVFHSHPGNFRPIEGLQKMLSKVAASSNGTDISQILSNVRNSPSKKLYCTVCWLPHFPKNKVYQCQECDMPCHISCCQGRPIYENKSDIPSSWICAVCENTPYTEVLRQRPESNDAHISSPSRKSQRSPKIPARYKDNEFKIEGSFWFKTYQMKSNKTDLPKCTLCPHSGK